MTALDEWAAIAAELEHPETAACPSCEQEQKVNKNGTIRKHKAAKTDVLPCVGSGAPVGVARIPRRSSAGFYKDPASGKLLRSVTTILNQGMAKEALFFWAAKVTAQAAMDRVSDMLRASRTAEGRDEFVKWLKMEPIRRRDERADLGSAVHRLIEARILGEPAPVHLTADPEMKPFIDHFNACVEEWEIRFLASEMVVAHDDDGYAGTLDYLFTSRLIAALLDLPADTIFPGDTKTGGELDATTYAGHVHGVYPTAGVQMAAYRKAPWGWLRDGTKIELPERADIGFILHLRPEGYRLYPARCGDDMYEVFQHARAMAEFETGLSKNVIGEALALPVLTTPATTRKIT